MSNINPAAIGGGYGAPMPAPAAVGANPLATNPAMAGMQGMNPMAGVGAGALGAAGGLNLAAIPLMGVSDLLQTVDTLVKQTEAEVTMMGATGQLQQKDPMGGAGGGAAGLAGLMGGGGGMNLKA